LLNFSMPSYAHVPVAANSAGEKLSKQTLAKPINTSLAAQQIVEALKFLGQNPPTELNDATLDDTWAWAIKHWNLANIPRQKQIKA
jgi:glutamyl-Q tRNA(Asp) synthetase